MAVKKTDDRARAHKLGLILVGIQLLLTIVCLGFLLLLDMLSPLLVAGIGLILILIWLILFLTQFTNKLHIRGKLISLVLSVVFTAGSFALAKANNLIGTITGSDYKIDKMSVIVMEDDPAEKIEDILDYSIGIQKISSGQEGKKAGDAITLLEEKYETELDTKGYSGLDEVVQALYDEEVDAVIINSAMITTVEEHFAGFSQDTRILEELSLKTQVETAQNQNKLDEPFNVFISGIDVYGDISTNSRSDVNIIATVNPETGQILLTTTPRDYYVEIPGVTKKRKDKLTHAGIYGVETSMATLEELYDIEIDYYVRVNFSGVENIVDAVDGITVYSEYSFSTFLEPHYKYKKGYNEMNGREALWFARDRKSVPGGERQRGKNQLQVIKGLVDKIVSPAILTNYSDLMDAVGESVQMNFSETQIKNLIKDQLKEGTQWNITSLSADGKDARDYCHSYSGAPLYVMYPDYDTVDYIKTVMDKVYEGEILTEEDEEGINHLSEEDE